MRVIIKIVMVALLFPMLTGCAAMWGGDTDIAYYKSFVKMTEHKNTLMAEYMSLRQKQDENFYAMNNDNPMAVMAYNYSMQSRDEDFFQAMKGGNLVRAKTFVDVADRHLGAIVSTATAGLVTYKGWDVMGEQQRNASHGTMQFDGDANFQDSFNISEIHATGDSNAVSVPGRVSSSVPEIPGIPEVPSE